MASSAIDAAEIAEVSTQRGSALAILETHAEGLDGACVACPGVQWPCPDAGRARNVYAAALKRCREINASLNLRLALGTRRALGCWLPG